MALRTFVIAIVIGTAFSFHPANAQQASPACDVDPKNFDRVTSKTPLGPASGLLCLDDGDSFSIGPAWVRLKGIDAPRVGRNCIEIFRKKGEVPERCRIGLDMLARLSDLIENGATCVAEKRDGLHRWLATCTTSDGSDLAAEMTRNGYACAATRYEQTYLPMELEARAAQRGLWSDGTKYSLSKMCRLGR